jgi:ElaB/YqjD/DUF883 family membrane-anchored ribosome-binding protein
MMEQQGTSATPEPKAAPRPKARAVQQPPASLTESADQAVQSLATLYTAADAALQQQMRTSPYTTLAAAAAVGFVLGGGLQSSMGQVLMRWSVRAFGRPLMNAALHSVLEHAGVDLDADASHAHAGFSRQ